MKISSTFLCLFSLIFSLPLLAEQPIKKDAKNQAAGASAFTSPNLSDLGNSSEPTFIQSKSLTIDSEKRVFTYSGDVEVKQGDLTLKSKTLEGTYNQNNQIEQLTAISDVDIVKGPDLHATSNKAVYNAKNAVITLTENPEITQKGSTLTADIVKIFTKENKSLAEGSVRMKVLQQTGNSEAPSFLPK